MSMLKVLYPAGARLEFVFRDIEYHCGFFGFLSNERIGDGDIIGPGFQEPFLKLFFDLGEFGRSSRPEWLVAEECMQRARGTPMLGHAHALMFRDVEPLGFVLQYFADRAAFDAISESNVLLSRAGVFLVKFTYGFSINIEKTLLSLLLARNDG
jgi:hypothetical protein